MPLVSRHVYTRLRPLVFQTLDLLLRGKGLHFVVMQLCRKAKLPDKNQAIALGCVEIRFGKMRSEGAVVVGELCRES